jgi:fluoroquinolone resistance protein
MKQIRLSDLRALAEERELSNLSFDGLSLVGYDFSDSVIEDCSFRGAILTDARFNASTIRRCEFAEAAVQGASFFGATLEECKMMGLDFTRGTRLAVATLKDVNLDYALLRGLDLASVEFTCCSLRECDLSGADLTDASLIDCDLTDADWTGATTRNTDLRGSSIRGVDLRTGPYGFVLTSPQAVSLVRDVGVQVIDPAEGP